MTHKASTATKSFGGKKQLASNPQANVTAKIPLFRFLRLLIPVSPLRFRVRFTPVTLYYIGKTEKGYCFLCLLPLHAVISFNSSDNRQ